MSNIITRNVDLPEILFGIVVLGLLTAILVPPIVYGNSLTAQCNANMALLNRGIELYQSKNGGLPPPSEAALLRSLVTEKVIPSSGVMPKCPHGTPYEYDPATGRIAPHKH